MTFRLTPLQTLLLFIVPPTVWALHFLTIYSATGVACAKLGSRGANLASLVTVGASVVALTVIMAVALISARETSLSSDEINVPGENKEPDQKTEESQSAFLSSVTLMLSVVSGAAVVFQTLPAFFAPSCQ